jgi:hypothetical protein
VKERGEGDKKGKRTLTSGLCYVCGSDFRSMPGVVGGRQSPASGV